MKLFDLAQAASLTCGFGAALAAVYAAADVFGMKGFFAVMSMILALLAAAAVIVQYATKCVIQARSVPDVLNPDLDARIRLLVHEELSKTGLLKLETVPGAGEGRGDSLRMGEIFSVIGDGGPKSLPRFFKPDALDSRLEDLAPGTSVEVHMYVQYPADSENYVELVHKRFSGENTWWFASNIFAEAFARVSAIVRADSLKAPVAQD